MSTGHITLGLFEIIATHQALARSGLTFNHRINGFQVAWVCRKGYVHLSIQQHACALIAQVVFHITITGDKIRNVVGCKFIQQRGQ